MRRRLVALCIAAICSLHFAPSSAEPYTGRITGHVVDVAGAIVPKASVFVRRTVPAEETVRLLTHTDAHGDFDLALPEGGYDVLVSSAGFASGFQIVPVFSGKEKRTHWKLVPLDCSFPRVNCDSVSAMR